MCKFNKKWDLCFYKYYTKPIYDQLRQLKINKKQLQYKQK